MTTRPSQRSISKMMPFLTEKWGNPMSPHRKGHEIHSDLKEAYQAIYSLLGASEEDSFVFTSSGAEAINHVINSLYFDQTLQSGRNHFITSIIEEAPPIMAIGKLEKLSCVGKMVHPDSHGRITLKAIADAITPRTALISLSLANGLTGVIHPMESISALCEERGIFFHLDVTHALGKLDISHIKADYITFNGDHLHAPKGSGGLLIKGKKKLSPFIVGGIEQNGLRAGSFNIGILAALGEASLETMDAYDYVCTEIARLRDKFEKGIIQGLDNANVLFKDEERLPNISTMAFSGIVNELFLFNLNKRGLFASIGGGSFQKIELILEHCEVKKTTAQTAINFNLSRKTTEDEIDKAIEIIIDEAQKLRKMSLHIMENI